MVCPFCLHKKTAVYNSRHASKLNVTWRRRRCLACEREFTTYEAADPGSILQIKNGRHITPFSHSRLLISIMTTCDHRSDVDEAVNYITGIVEQHLYKQCAETKNHWVAKQDIVAVTLGALHRFDATAYIKYLSKHQPNLDAPSIRKALRRKK